MTEAPTCLRFLPSRVEGLPEVTEVAVYPDRLEVRTAGRWVACPFAAMARTWLGRALARVGLRPRPRMVADRDWFHTPPDRFFAFYTKPPLKIYMPADEPPDPYAETYFFRIQEVMRAGRCSTFDLG